VTALAAIVEVKTLAKVVLYALLSGVGIAVIFGVGVSSVASVLDAMRAGRSAVAGAWGALAFVCLAGTIALIVLGIVVMATK
jgi:hypothetical protein